MKYTHANIHNKCASMGVNGHASVDSTCSLDNFQTQAIKPDGGSIMLSQVLEDIVLLYCVSLVSQCPKTLSPHYL